MMGPGGSIIDLYLPVKVPAGRHSVYFDFLKYTVMHADVGWRRSFVRQ